MFSHEDQELDEAFHEGLAYVSDSASELIRDNDAFDQANEFFVTCMNYPIAIFNTNLILPSSRIDHNSYVYIPLSVPGLK